MSYVKSSAVVIPLSTLMWYKASGSFKVYSIAWDFYFIFFLINQHFSNAFQQNYLLYVFICYTGLACEIPG